MAILSYVNIVIYLLLFLVSCARSPLKNIEEAMRVASNPPTIEDSFLTQEFLVSLASHIENMKTSAKVTDPMILGPIKISKEKYIASLEEILKHEGDLIPWINTYFTLYEVYGYEHWGEVLTTGYYEPQVKGALEESALYSQPLYSLPIDLTIPYFERKEIDVDKKLEGRNLELAWVNPIDAFFIQIQGTGLVEFPNGEVKRFGYAGKNGQPYVPIGKFLTDVIPLDQMSMQKIRTHLESLSPNELQDIFNKNPSYVFFKILEGGALTSAGMEVVQERTIATDMEFFPKGALAFLDIEDPISHERKPRLVFDQDTGGAIKGGGRIDLYYGSGEEAARQAGIMKKIGRLYYLVPKTP